MNMKKTWKFMATSLVVMMMCLCLQPYGVEAGLSHIVVDSSSVKEELNTATWNNPDNDITVQDGKILFSAESTKYTRLITKSTVEKIDESNELVSTTFTMNIKSIPKDGEFILGFGLGNIESLSQDAGQVEVAFINKGSMKVAVRSYENAGDAKEVIAPKAANFSIGKNTKIIISIGNNQSITVKANGQTIASGTLPFDAEGSVGFFQTGQCQVEISDFCIQSYQYDRPENSDFKENFDEDAYNSNLLFSKAVASAYVPSTMSVEQYEENDVMWFENSGPGQIGTLQQYSNFELTFDVPYLLRENIEDENGNVLYEKSQWIGVSFGDEMIECVDNGYAYSADMVYFDRDSKVKSFANNNQVVAESEKYPFFAKDETRGFSVKVSVVDAHVTIGIKWLDETKFTTIGEYDTADLKTPLGYVHIWTCGPANFAIDNIQMKNLDDKPNLVEVEYKTSKFEVPEDYKYKEDEMVYRQERDEKEEMNWYLLIPCTIGVGVVIIGICAAIAAVKKRKGGNLNGEI